VTSHSEQKHSAVRIAPSQLNKSQSRSGASDGSRDPGSPAGLLPAGTLDGLGSHVDQTGGLLDHDFLQAIQTHGPDRPAGQLEPRPASPNEGTTKA
jgi:hypothetical protein